MSVWDNTASQGGCITGAFGRSRGGPRRFIDTGWAYNRMCRGARARSGTGVGAGAGAGMACAGSGCRLNRYKGVCDGIVQQAARVFA